MCELLKVCGNNIQMHGYNLHLSPLHHDSPSFLSPLCLLFLLSHCIVPSTVLLSIQQNVTKRKGNRFVVHKLMSTAANVWVCTSCLFSLSAGRWRCGGGRWRGSLAPQKKSCILSWKQISSRQQLQEGRSVFIISVKNIQKPKLSFL